MTKYEVIIRDIRKKIQNGSYPVNGQIPTETELCSAYKVSRITVKKAVDQLVAEGLVIKRRGSGTFVKGLSDGGGKVAQQQNGLFSELDKSKIQSKIIRFEVVPAGKEVGEKLNISPDDFVYHIIRYREGEGNWRVMDYCYMPIDLIPGLKREVLLCSIYSYIEHTLGLRIQSAHRVVRAIRPNEYDRKYLGMKAADPVLSILQVGYLDSGVPFEYSDQHHIGDEFEFKAVSIR